MNRFFYPSSIAVFGVADHSRNLAKNIVGQSLEFGYKGAIYPVGREPGTVQGKRVITDPGALPEGIDLAVILVMVYVYLPYMILPLYSVLEKLDFTLLNAAMDLGANEIKAFFRITLPLAVEGIFAGTLLVFIPALGAYLIPQLVGNQRSLYIGQVITYKIKNIPRNWPMASALSLTLLLLVALMLLVMYWLYRRHLARRQMQ